MRSLSFALPLAALGLALLSPTIGSAQNVTAIEPCGLLTIEEVSEVMGAPVDKGEMTDNGITQDGAYSTTCVWKVALPPNVGHDHTKPLGGRPFAVLNVMSWEGGANSADKFLKEFHKAFETREIPTEPARVDVGADEALWWGDGVAARVDGISIGMSVAQIADRDQRQPKAESLARRVVSRLPKDPG